MKYIFSGKFNHGGGTYNWKLDKKMFLKIAEMLENDSNNIMALVENRDSVAVCKLQMISLVDDNYYKDCSKNVISVFTEDEYINAIKNIGINKINSNNECEDSNEFKESY